MSGDAAAFRIAILEDNPLHAEALEAMVLAHPEAPSFAVRWCPDVASLERWAREAPVDVLLADIVLDGDPACPVPVSPSTSVAALSACGALLRRTQVIYVTGYAAAYPSLHTVVYETPHCGFLAKPVDPALLAHALTKALDVVEKGRCEPLLVKTKNALVRVDPSDIVFVESRLNRLFVHCLQGRYDTYGSLTKAAAALPVGFVRCHQSFLVNLDHVAELTASEVVTDACSDDGLPHRLPISHTRRTSTRKAYGDHVLRRL